VSWENDDPAFFLIGREDSLDFRLEGRKVPTYQSLQLI
jgi:hypothetical protein